VSRSPAPSVTAAPKPRGTALANPFVIDLPTEGGFAVAADDGALASVTRAPDGSTQLFVIDLRTSERHRIATQPGLFIYLMPGALRKDLVTYFQQEERGGRAGGGEVVTWHVMVANWRTGAAPTEIDAVVGEIDADPHANMHLPNPVTNGRDVVWLHAPRVDGKAQDTEVRRWTSGVTTTVYRGEGRYALDDDGRLALAAPRDSEFELLIVDPSGASRQLAIREMAGTPYLAGPKVVWPREAGALAVTSADVFDVLTRSSVVVVFKCPFIGATVRHLVFGCRDAGSRVVSVDDRATNDTDAFFFRADPHAIIGRDHDRWTVTPVAS
jgi:hypothetical protein